MILSDDPNPRDQSRQLARAHDLRNVLTIVRGYSSLLLRRLGSEAEGRTELEEIDRASARATVLASELAEEIETGSPRGSQTEP